MAYGVWAAARRRDGRLGVRLISLVFSFWFQKSRFTHHVLRITLQALGPVLHVVCLTFHGVCIQQNRLVSRVMVFVTVNRLLTTVARSGTRSHGGGGGAPAWLRWPWQVKAVLIEAAKS